MNFQKLFARPGLGFGFVVVVGDNSQGFQFRPGARAQASFSRRQPRFEGHGLASFGNFYKRVSGRVIVFIARRRPQFSGHVFNGVR